MKLYYSPGACSLADHIALLEAGLQFEHERVDLKQKKTASGADYLQINRKGYVPTLVLDDGETITENPAILDWIAQQDPRLGVDGKLGRTRLLEVLSFISAELHKTFHPFFAGGSDEVKEGARKILAMRFQLLAGKVQQHEYLFGDQPTVADFYLLVMLLWADRFGLELPDTLAKLRDRLLSRASVGRALQAEGWPEPRMAMTAGMLSRKTGT